MDLQTFRKEHSQVALSSADMSEMLRQEPENHVQPRSKYVAAHARAPILA